MNINQTLLNQFNVRIDRLLQMSGLVHVYWKDLQGVYLGCNDLMAEHVKLPSASEVLGKTDYAFAYHKEEADTWRSDDSEVLITGPKSFYNSVHLEHMCFDSIDVKMPLYNNDNQICGVLGISQILNVNYYGTPKNKFTESFSYQKNNLDKVFVKNSIRLSPRQLECVIYLLKGMTAKEIAHTLSLSYRTIEAYISDIIIKFHCSNRLQLISKIYSYLLKVK